MYAGALPQCVHAGGPALGRRDHAPHPDQAGCALSVGADRDPGAERPDCHPQRAGRVRLAQGPGQADHRRPAQNIAVELRPEIPTDASDPPRASTRTGQDGRYALERIANGRYLLSAGGGGAGSPQANVTGAGLDQTLDLEVESVARAPVWLQLTGRVVDANDRGVPGARVWEAGGECHATTAADGTYRLVVIGDPGGPRRILDATTSDRSGFVLATEGSPQPPIRLTRPALSGVPSDVCPTGQRASQGRDVA